MPKNIQLRMAIVTSLVVVMVMFAGCLSIFSKGELNDRNTIDKDSNFTELLSSRNQTSTTRYTVTTTSERTQSDETTPPPDPATFTYPAGANQTGVNPDILSENTAKQIESWRLNSHVKVTGEIRSNYPGVTLHRWHTNFTFGPDDVLKTAVGYHGERRLLYSRDGRMYGLTGGKKRHDYTQQWSENWFAFEAAGGFDSNSAVVETRIPNLLRGYDFEAVNKTKLRGEEVLFFKGHPKDKYSPLSTSDANVSKSVAYLYLSSSGAIRKLETHTYEDAYDRYSEHHTINVFRKRDANGAYHTERVEPPWFNRAKTHGLELDFERLENGMLKMDTKRGNLPPLITLSVLISADDESDLFFSRHPRDSSPFTGEDPTIYLNTVGTYHLAVLKQIPPGVPAVKATGKDVSIYIYSLHGQLLYRTELPASD